MAKQNQAQDKLHAALFDSPRVGRIFNAFRKTQKFTEDCFSFFAVPFIQQCLGKKSSSGWFSWVRNISRMVVGLPLVSLFPVWLLSKGTQMALSHNRMHDHLFTSPTKTSAPRETKVKDDGTTAKGKPLRIATCNTIGLNSIVFALGNKPNGADPSERLPAIARELVKKDLDIICFQEIFDDRAATKLQRELNQHGYYVISHIGDNHALKLNSGLTIASKYKILAAHYVPFLTLISPSRIPTNI